MPRSEEVIEVQSIGGGVQSMAVYCMSAMGVLPKAHGAIFADTGWERHATLENIKRLQEMDLGIPIYIAKSHRGTVRSQAMNPDYDFINMPVFTESSTGKKGQTKRQCTDHYKLRPIRKKLTEIWGRKKFRQWIGISLDEAMRMKKSDVKYIENYYPLVETLRYTRADCIKWLEDNGFGVPVKSSCIGCPYHDNDAWLSLTEAERKDAIEVDEAIRDLHENKSHKIAPRATVEGQSELVDLQAMDEVHDNPDFGVRVSDMKLYLHPSRSPLKEVYKNPQQVKQEELFNLEDEGGCGGNCFL